MTSEKDVPITKLWERKAVQSPEKILLEAYDAHDGEKPRGGLNANEVA